MKAPSWSPRFTLTPAIARGLMQIEAARALVEHTTIPPAAEAELRAHARVRAVHYSTFIEGNRLTMSQAKAAIADANLQIAGRERDVSEVRNYWNALLRVEDWAQKKKPLTEELIKRLHALVEVGPRAKPTPYREGQNAIKNSSTGALIYLPPEAEDVPSLMASLVAWAAEAERSGLPAPLIAGLVHYQFVTIHPYYDGNGRTARLLATFILHKGGYGLNGFFSLEEHHARDLPGYYQALTTHPHHNYYFGRSEADVTPWLEYFISTLAAVFEAVRLTAQKCAFEGRQAEPEELRRLDHRERVVLGLFASKETVTAPQVAAELGLSERMARNLLTDWVRDGWLEVADPSRRARSYSLSAKYRQYIGSLSAIVREEENNEQ
ncbi:Fic family protein [Methanothrix soehngenii]|uniref:Fic family protein n=1 Tax=Methanothrix soehngenii TaxID=2223 RepID=UPI00300C2606